MSAKPEEKPREIIDQLLAAAGVRCRESGDSTESSERISMESSGH